LGGQERGSPILIIGGRVPGMPPRVYAYVSGVSGKLNWRETQTSGYSHNAL